MGLDAGAPWASIFDAATLNSPETATVASPLPGAWQVTVDAFEVPKGKAAYTLTVKLNGTVLKLK